jgi:hypothetical protein
MVLKNWREILLDGITLSTFQEPGYIDNLISNKIDYTNTPIYINDRYVDRSIKISETNLKKISGEKRIYQRKRKIPRNDKKKYPTKPKSKKHKTYNIEKL